jgi:hypothetical protein
MSDEPIVTRPPSPSNLYYAEMGREIEKQTIPRLSDALQRIITLSTAMLGGSAFFLTPGTIPDGAKAGSLFLFLMSLTMAFWGSLPYGCGVCPTCPDEVREFRRGSVEWKWWLLAWSSWLLLFGLAFIAIGFIWKHL